MNSHHRLQRPPDFTGDWLYSLQQVVFRHGLPGALLAVLLLAHPDLRALLSVYVVDTGYTDYLLTGSVIWLAMSAYAISINRQKAGQQCAWVIYLGMLSLWEECLFRLALPKLIEAGGLDFWLAALIANLAFGAMHYFTLRWKWTWCFAAFLGGMALSRQLHLHQDLLLITAYHWIGTFINTPRCPDLASAGSRPIPLRD